jgi:hypothetical protein
MTLRFVVADSLSDTKLNTVARLNQFSGRVRARPRSLEFTWSQV